MNRRPLELVVGPLRAARRATIVWSASMAGLVAMTVAFWPAFKDSAALLDMVNQLPQNMIQAFGLQGFGTPAGYLRGNLYAFFVPLLLAGAAIGFANSLLASEEDGGRIEALMTQPVSRQAFFLGRALAAFGCLVVVVVALAITQFASNAFFGLPIAAERLVSTIVLAGLLAALHGSLALAVVGLRPRPALVLGLPLFVAIAGCVAEALFPLSSGLEPLAHLSPWDWAFAGDPLINAAEPWRYLALALPTVALTVLGTIAFTRRDIRAA